MNLYLLRDAIRNVPRDYSISSRKPFSQSAAFFDSIHRGAVSIWLHRQSYELLWRLVSTTGFVPFIYSAFTDLKALFAAARRGHLRAEHRLPTMLMIQLVLQITLWWPFKRDPNEFLEKILHLCAFLVHHLDRLAPSDEELSYFHETETGIWRITRDFANNVSQHLRWYHSALTAI